MYDVKYVYNVFLKYMYISVKEMSVKVNIYIFFLLVLAFLLSLIIFWPFIQIMIRYTQNTILLLSVWCLTGHSSQVYFTITRSVFQYLSCFIHWAQAPSVFHYHQKCISVFILFQSLGTAPKWCAFLDTLTEELEESEHQSGLWQCDINAPSFHTALYKNCIQWQSTSTPCKLPQQIVQGSHPIYHLDMPTSSSVKLLYC